MWNVKLNNKKKKKYMSHRWDNEQKKLLLRLWKSGMTYEEISSDVNELICQIAKLRGFNTYPVRTANAVAIQCEKLGLITENKLKKWQNQQEKSRQKARGNNLSKAKEQVMTRDDYKCVICGVEEKLVFAHIIPFEETRVNIVIEAVTLCKEHHKHFDDRCKKCVYKIFIHMTKIYSDYQNKYEIKTLNREKCQIIQITQ